MINFPESHNIEKESHKYIKKNMSSWKKRFKPTLMEEIFEGVDLANYLVALNRTDEAIDLLKFITIQIEFTGNYNIWSPAGSAIILLSRLLRIGRSSDYEKNIERIIKNDFYNTTRKKEYYLDTLEEHLKIITEAKQDTQKWACLLISRHLMALNYQMETGIKNFKDTEDFDLILVEKNIIESYKLLKEKLK